jgi:hypothetical protein
MRFQVLKEVTKMGNLKCDAVQFGREIYNIHIRCHIPEKVIFNVIYEQAIKITKLCTPVSLN